jgi:hypothetical protein
MTLILGLEHYKKESGLASYRPFLIYNAPLSEFTKRFEPNNSLIFRGLEYPIVIGQLFAIADMTLVARAFLIQFRLGPFGSYRI